jgi:hypothetical protein
MGNTTICGNNTSTLVATADCCGIITWSNGSTGNTIQVSAGSYYAMCDGKKSATFVVTNTGSCACVETSWTNTGRERCVNNISQQEQISNCGNYRWIDGGSICVTSPCVPVKFQSLLNAPVSLSYQCNGLQTVNVPPLGCIVINTIYGAWTYPSGTLVPTLNGTCVTSTFTKVRTQSFQRNNCANNCTGGTYSYSQTYTSFVSQQDADNLASNDPNFLTNGQNAANTNGSCTGVGCTCVSVWVNSGTPQCINNQLIQHQIDTACGGSRDINVGTCGGGNICNTEQVATGTFTRNNCAPGCTALSMNAISIPTGNKTIIAGTYCGTDQNTVNAQALAAAQALAQNYVNSQSNLCINCPVGIPTIGNVTITQHPSCSNGATGIVSFTGITNGDRYRYCNGNVFNCTNSCLTPDGTFSGSSFTWNIPLICNGNSETYTVRVYNGTDCSKFTDSIVSFNSCCCCPTTGDISESAVNCTNSNYDVTINITSNGLGICTTGVEYGWSTTNSFSSVANWQTSSIFTVASNNITRYFFIRKTNCTTGFLAGQSTRNCSNNCNCQSYFSQGFNDPINGNGGGSIEITNCSGNQEFIGVTNNECKVFNACQIINSVANSGSGGGLSYPQLGNSCSGCTSLTSATIN